AYYLLAVSTLSAGLYLAFVLAGEWLDGEKRAVVPLFLALVPFYNFLGLKFDQNSAQIPLWALTIWAFARSIETRGMGWAALAGAAGAAALLTKYWAAFLLLAIAVAAVLDRRRSAYFKSPAPWTSTAVGALVLAPHVLWLFTNDFPPFKHATDRQAHSLQEFFFTVATEHLAAMPLYAGIALGLLALLIPPRLATFRDIVTTPDNHRRLVLNLFWLPIVTPILGAAIAKVYMISLWNAPAYSLMPVVLLASPLVRVTRTMVAWFAGAVAVVSLGALAAAPMVSTSKLRDGSLENDAAYVRALAAEVEKQWRLTTDRPLTVLAGPFVSVHSTAFYLPGKPITLGFFLPYTRSRDIADYTAYISPWADPDTVRRRGVAIFCPATNRYCLERMDELVAAGPAGRHAEVEITPH